MRTLEGGRVTQRSVLPAPRARLAPAGPATPTTGAAALEGRRGSVEVADGLDRRSVLAGYAALAATVVAVTALSARYLPLVRHRPVFTPVVLGWRWAWANWDGAWYLAIAQHGYAYHRGPQSSTAFFPVYPLALRVVASVVGNDVLAGVLVTLAGSAAAALLYATWLQARVSPAATAASLLLIGTFPYAYYLYGTLYGDALFLALAIGAFVALEHEHPVASGVLGALAAASRPVGIAVVVGLALRAYERRDVLAVGPSSTTAPRAARGFASHTALPATIAACGLVAYPVYLWQRFGNAFAFVAAEGGWHQAPGPRAWSKVQLLHELVHSRSIRELLVRLAHPLITIVALALVPAVIRRFGWAYGVYVLVVLGIPALSTKDFFGMARYAVAAFPCFAVAGAALAKRRQWVVPLTVAVSTALLLLLASLFARGYYLS